MQPLDTAPAPRHDAAVFRYFVLSLRQLGDPRILAVLAKSLALTLIKLAVLGTALWFLVGRAVVRLGLDPASAELARALGVLLTLGAVWLLFRVIAIAAIGLFGDDVVVAVERRYYPQAAVLARPVPLARALAMGLAAAGRALLVNLALVPVYLLLLVTGVGTPILFLVANGWLLGRDFGDMVAARHLDAAVMRDWRAANAGSRFVAGLVASGLFMVPVVNLLAPILGAAMATHVFHGRRNEQVERA